MKTTGLDRAIVQAHATFAAGMLLVLLALSAFCALPLPAFADEAGAAAPAADVSAATGGATPVFATAASVEAADVMPDAATEVSETSLDVADHDAPVLVDAQDAATEALRLAVPEEGQEAEDGPSPAVLPVSVVLEASVSSQASLSVATVATTRSFVLCDAEGTPLQTKVFGHDQGATVVFFDPLTFSEPGSFAYTIREMVSQATVLAPEAASAEGQDGSAASSAVVVSDAHVEQVRVDVALNAEGTALTAVVVTDADGAVFGNDSPAPATASQVVDAPAAADTDATGEEAAADADAVVPEEGASDSSAAPASSADPEVESSNEEASVGTLQIAQEQPATASSTTVSTAAAPQAPPEQKAAPEKESVSSVIAKTYDTLGGHAGVFACIMMVSLVVLAYSLQRCRTDSD